MKISQIQRSKLSKHSWCVFTACQMTQRAISENLADRGNASDSRMSIFYDGKEISVFRIPFEIAEFLAKNKIANSYSCTIYHKERSSVPWSVWNEGRTTPLSRLTRLTGLFSEAGRQLPKARELRNDAKLRKVKGRV